METTIKMDGHMIWDPAIRFKECNCEVCKGMMPQDIIDLLLDNGEQGLKKLISHNLLGMKKALAGGR